jgi:hypothetical protein
VWERLNVIEVSGRPAGSASWQAPMMLSNVKDMASSPQVALDSHGDAVAVWESFDGSEYAIEAATRSGLGGSWQVPVVLKMVGTMPSAGPDLAIDPQGDAIAIWPREEKTIEAAGRPAGGLFQKPETLSSTAQAQHRAEVGIDAAGDATAVWEEDIGGEIFTEASSKTVGGKWQTAVSLSAAGGNANEPRVAVDAQGDAVAVWERFEGEEIIEAASRPRSGSVWVKPVALTKPEPGKGEPAGQQVAIDGQGDAVAVWSRTNGTHDFVEAANGRTSSSVWQSPITLSGPGATVEEAPQVAVNDSGDAVVVWERSNGVHEIIEGSSGSAAAGSWQTPVSISADGEEAGEPQVALDAQGAAIAVWKRFDGSNYIAEAAGSVAPATMPITGSNTNTTITKSLPLILLRPTITGARLSSSRFRVSKRPTAISAKFKAKPKVPQGTSFHFTLNEAADLRIAFTHPAVGLRSGKRCVAPRAKLRHGHAKRCKRVVTDGALSRANEQAGSNTVAFSGRIGSKTLRPGAYTATLTASAGGLSSAPVALSLTVVR